MVNEKINSWTFEETVKTAENLMKNEKNIFKWDVLRHLKDFAETYQKEIQQYRTIGTVEECRAAVEKQTAKKVVSFEYHNGTINYGCPVCKWKIISKINGEWCCGTFNEYCDRCGQKLDWSDEDEKI